MARASGKTGWIRWQPLLLATLAGCAPTGGDVSPAKPTAAGEPTTVGDHEKPWFEAAALRHDLGVAVGPEGANLSHTYRLTNRSANAIRVLAVRNERPCCGDVDAAVPAVLAPGQALEVRVKLHAARSAGKLQHLAVVEMETPAAPAEIVTTAAFVPRAAIEESGDARHALLPGESAAPRFVVRGFGTKEHPPTPLDGATLGGDCAATWDGAATLEESGDGLIASRRECVATIQATGTPGARSSEIVVNAGRDELARHRVSWEVSPAIKASPAGLIVSADDRSPQKVLLRAADGRPFRVVSARCEPEGLRVAGATAESLARHLLEIGPGLAADINAAKTADVIVATDHPRQAEVRITVFISPKTATGAKEGSP